MKMKFDAKTLFSSKDKALEIAIKNNEAEDDCGWSYKVEPFGERFAIAVSCEDGLIGYL
jgi:hypothetical protein